MWKERYLDQDFVERMKARYFKRKKLESLKPRNMAIIAIDLQNYFLSPSGKAYLPSAPYLLKKLEEFYSFSENIGLEIIFTQHCHKGNNLSRWWGDDMECEGDDFEIHPTLRKFSRQIIGKHTYSAFYDTPLEKILRERDVDTLIITGVMTHLCCETTARDAFNRGFTVIFPIDGTATQNRELHECSLRALSHGFAATPTLKDVMEWMH